MEGGGLSVCPDHCPAVAGSGDIVDDVTAGSIWSDTEEEESSIVQSSHGWGRSLACFVVVGLKMNKCFFPVVRVFKQEK